MYDLAYFFVFIFLKIFHRLKVYGKENIPKTKAFIIVSNHASYYDPPVLATSVYPRKIRFMAKTELFKNPLASFFFKRFGAFPVSRQKVDRKSLQKAFELLRENAVVGIFPEGTRVKSKEERQVFKGAAYLASKSKAPILPVGIVGTQHIMLEGSFLPRLAKVELNVGKPIWFKGGNKSDLFAFSDKIIGEIDKLSARRQMSDIRRQHKSKG